MAEDTKTKTPAPAKTAEANATTETAAPQSLSDAVEQPGRGAEAVIGDVTKLEDGQIALSARNEGDGTWSVRLGPGGPVLYEGLPMEKALAIVGAPTGPHVPLNRQEADAAEEREGAEEAASEYVNAEALKSDKELGIVDARGRPVFADEPEPVRLKAKRRRSSDGARGAGRASERQNGRSGNGSGTAAGGDAG
jgi:hypothetical protein